MLDQLILYTMTYMGLVYATGTSMVRVVLGRVCRTSSWCMTTLLLTTSALLYLGHYYHPSLYEAEAIPYIIISTVIVSLLISVILLSLKVGAYRTRQRI